MKLKLFIFLFILVSAAHASDKKETEPSIIGKWEYIGCTIKNTSVQGTIEFKKNGTFIIDAEALDDYPVPPIRGTYHYSVEDRRIKTDYQKGYGLEPYFLIVENYYGIQNHTAIFFSNTIIHEIEEDNSGSFIRANWHYKLKKIR